MAHLPIGCEYGYTVMVWKLPKYMVETAEHVIRPALLKYAYLHPDGLTARLMLEQVSDAVNGKNALLLLSGYDTTKTRGFDVLRQAVEGVDRTRVARAQELVDRMRAAWLKETQAEAYEEERRRWERRHARLVAIVNTLEDLQISGVQTHADIDSAPESRPDPDPDPDTDQDDDPASSPWGWIDMGY